MKHLTDEQLEQIMGGYELEPDHLKSCQLCRTRLTEMRGLASRLSTAFESIKPEQELLNSIRTEIAQADTEGKGISQNIFDLRRHWRGWATGISAAAAMMVLIPLLMMQASYQPAMAIERQAEIAHIHEENLSGDHEFHSESEPEKLAAYFNEKLGFDLRIPKAGQGLKLRGCCVRHFQGKVVGSYVVDTPEGVISIVVVTDKAKSLGIGDKFTRDGHTYWKSAFAKCDMVSVRIGDYTYCAVGEISHEYLTNLLSKLIPEKVK